jgi:hypothetical protein
MILSKIALRKVVLALAAPACVGICISILPADARAESPDPAGKPLAAAEPAPAAAEAPSGDSAPVETSLEQTFAAPAAASVGERLEMRLEIAHPVHTTVHLPETLPNPRWELSDTVRETGVTEGRRRTSLTLVFQIFRPGATTLPSFELTLLGADGKLTTLKTEPVEAKIVSVLPPQKTPALKAARGPVAVWTDDYTLLWAGGTLLGIALAGALTLLVARRGRPEDPGPPPRPAHLVALEKLSALTTGDLLDQGEYMLFYVRMSEAIREYLGRRYGFPGTELTTTEILDHLGAVDAREGWPAEVSFEDVRDWLNYCDLVKFSDMHPERERTEQALRQAFSMVELTRPKAPESDEESSDSDAPENIEDSENAESTENTENAEEQP